jgi:hypothetical protein
MGILCAKISAKHQSSEYLIDSISIIGRGRAIQTGPKTHGGTVAPFFKHSSTGF